MKVFIWFLAILFFAVADEKTALLLRIKENTLLQNGAHLIKEERHTFLIGVGSSKIKSKSIKSKLEAIKESQMKAQKAMVIFVHGSEVSVKEQLYRKTVTEGKKKTQTKTRYQQIKEKSNGILTSLQALGRWQEGDRYFYAYYFDLGK